MRTSTTTTTGTDFDRQVARLAADHGEQVPIADVARIVFNLLETGRREMAPGERRIHDELEALARFIERARHEICAIRPEDIAARCIPLASDELDAIGAHLEEATGTILDSCEQVEAVGETLEGEAAATINNAVTAIYEACNFQDLTGQRITKVVDTLQTIERRIDRLLQAIGHRAEDSPVAEPSAPTGDAALLNGPQPPSAANSQADIDALLASFE